MTKVEREASRRLLRQATAAHNAQVKGNCLMVMQLLTRREVIRTHAPWQLMTKHAMWMAFEHRRSLENMPERSAAGPAPVTMLEACVEDSGEDDDASSGRSAVDDNHECEVGAGPAKQPDQGAQSNFSVPSEPAGCLRGGEAHGGPRAVGVKVRRKNDSFYDDYLHRGVGGRGGKGAQTPTPLSGMCYLEYGRYVRVVPGDPWRLRFNQYALDEIHTK